MHGMHFEAKLKPVPHYGSFIQQFFVTLQVKADSEWFNDRKIGHNYIFNTMKHIFCIIISSLVFVSSYAQTNYIETSHYIFPEFTQGLILMKDGKRNDALLNYNSLTEEMIFENNGQKRAIRTDEILLIDTVFIKDRKFVPLDGRFVELVHHSKWDLYVEHKCKVEEQGKPSGYGGTSQTGAATSVSSLYSQGRVVYDLKLPDDFKTKPYSIYWLKKSGELNEFINMRELKKFYKDKKDLFKKYSKTNGVKFQDQESIVQLIEYLESN